MVLTGQVADPSVDRGTPKLQYLFINGRFVSATFGHALQEAYRGLLLTGRYAVAFLFIDMPPDMVDVNVHPTKMEVRFREQSQVHQIVRHALGDALGKGPAPELTLRTSDVLPGRPMQPSIPGALGGGSFPSRWAAAGSGRWFSTKVHDAGSARRFAFEPA